MMNKQEFIKKIQNLSLLTADPQTADLKEKICTELLRELWTELQSGNYNKAEIIKKTQSLERVVDARIFYLVMEKAEAEMGTGHVGEA